MSGRDVQACDLVQGGTLVLATLALSAREYAGALAQARIWLAPDDAELAALEKVVAQRLADIDLCRAWVTAQLMNGRPARQGDEGG